MVPFSRVVLIGLYKGYWLTNMVWIPWSMINISTQETLQLLYSKRQQRHLHNTNPQDYILDSSITSQPQAIKMPTSLYTLTAMFATTLATILTHPADVIKTRF